MRRIKVYLLGKHSKRCPFSYPDYQQSLAKYFEYTGDLWDTDIVASGFIQDFKESLSSLLELKESRPGVKLVVLSEEPLWDSLWGGSDILKRWTKIQESAPNGRHLDIRHINHFNSDIFSFCTVPYFLTTSPVYISRYLQALSHLKNGGHKLISKINTNKAQPYNLIGMFERRTEDCYKSKTLPSSSLSVFRTKLADNLIKLSESQSYSNLPLRVNIEGKGWHQRQKTRQSLGDWHLDKFSRFLGSNSIVFAYENTIAPNYITEKVFDAVFSLNIPLYHADSSYCAALRGLFGKEKIGLATTSLNEQEACKEIFDQLDNFSDLQDQSLFAMFSLGARLTELMLPIVRHETNIRSRKIYEQICGII